MRPFSHRFFPMTDSFMLGDASFAAALDHYGRPTRYTNRTMPMKSIMKYVKQKIKDTGDVWEQYILPENKEEKIALMKDKIDKSTKWWLTHNHRQGIDILTILV